MGRPRARSTTGFGESRRLSKIVRRVGSLNTAKTSPACTEAWVRLDLRCVTTYACHHRPSRRDVLLTNVQGGQMANNPVLWFEVMGKDGKALRNFYSKLF